MSDVDPTSFANFACASIKHFHLNLEVSFVRSVLSGFVDLTVVVNSSSDKNNKIVLDTKDLTIHSVQDVKNNAPLNAVFGEEHAVFGRALTIDLPDQTKEVVIRIAYETSPSSSACQWLPPSQTSGKVHPYLFTQCQAIHCRTLIPLQDSPAVKQTYTASITVPKPLVALMSAIQQGSQASLSNNTTTYFFQQTVPMPSYLVAIAVGALESRKLGPRSNVWSEAATVDIAAAEFVDTEKFLVTAEAICGPYVWKQYDLLLLPPSFPYGGMENPCLTFVTPTLLAGDKSLVNVVAHEIAHSWTGNLVGCHTWESFWLNEGWTVFVERKIGRRLHGIPHAHLDAVSGFKALSESVARYGDDHPFTCLHCKLNNIDPDDAFSSVPYEKGFNFLFYLEQLVGGETVFDPFTIKYIANFAFKTCTTEQFKKFFLDYFTPKVAKEKLDTIDWESWLYKPGMPIVPPAFDRSLVDSAVELAVNLTSNLSSSSSSSSSPSPVDISTWSTNQKLVFLEKLTDIQQSLVSSSSSSSASASASASGSASSFSSLLLSLNSQYGLNGVGNAEIKFRWAQLAIRSGLLNDDAIKSSVITFLTSQGRMKFVRPLYRDLYTSPIVEYKKLAQETFKANKQAYHSIAQKMVAKDLELDS